MFERLTSWLTWSRQASRQLRKHPQLTTVTVLTLALGIGVNAMIFAVVDVVLFRRPPYPLADQIVELRGPGQGFVSFGRSVEVFPAALRDLSIFQSTGVYIAGGINLGGGSPRRLAAAAVSPGFFDVLATRAAVGTVFTPQDVAASPRLVVLGWALWQGEFGGDVGIIGREIVLDDTTFVVTGVMPEGVSFPEDAQLWVPTEAPTGVKGQIPTAVVVARLQPGVDTASTRLQVMDVAKIAAADAESVTVVRLQEALVGRTRPTALLIGFASVLLLLVACANITNLLLAHLWRRRSELATRYAVGAEPAQLLRQLFVDVILLASLGAMVAIPAVVWLLGAARAWLPQEWDGIAAVAVDHRLILAMVAVTIGAAGLCALIPGIWLWSWVRHSAVDGRTIGDGRRWNRIRTGLVVVEIAVAVFLLSAAGILVRSVSGLMQTDIGASGERALAMKVSLPNSRYPNAEARRRFLDHLDSTLRSIPGVEAVGLSDQLPGRSTDLLLARRISIDGAEAGTRGPSQDAVVLSASPGFFTAVGIDVLAGRTFDAHDGTSSPTVVVVSEGFGRALGMAPGELLGKRLGSRPGSTVIPPEIVGVVRDIRLHGPDRPFVAAIYRPVMSSPPANPIHVVAKTRSDNPVDVVPALRSAVARVDGNMPLYDIDLFLGIRRAQTADRRLAMTAMLIFGGLTLVLCAVGLYGLIAHTAETGRRDVAVRIALGAGRRAIYQRTLGPAALQSVVGVAIGVAGIMAAARLFSSRFGYLGDPQPGDLALVSVLVFVFAMLAAALPMYGAASVDPAQLLRTANRPGMRA